MEHHPKRRVVEGFLAFVERYVPLKEAYLATLGGWGLEASIWNAREFTPERTWLIECGRKSSRKLIARFPFRYCSSLKQFPKAFRTARGNGVHGVDGFHLDLCGTYESSDVAFGPSLSLIRESRGRCFAVTVADQRGNTSVENFGTVYKLCQTYFGVDAARQIYSELLETQQSLWEVQADARFEPEKGAQRELGLILRLARAFTDYGLVPDVMERYVYVSYQLGSPFRMRTYFFHLRLSQGEKDEVLRIWKASSTYLVSRGGLLLVTPTKETARMAVTEEKETDPYAELYTLCRAAGSKFVDALDAMRADAEIGRRVRSIVTEVAPQKPATPAPALPPPVADPLLESIPDRRLRAQISMVRARAESPATLDALKHQLLGDREVSGTDRNSKGRVIGALLAQTQGKFRPHFIRRSLMAVNGQGDELLTRLAADYSKIEGTEITPEMLRNEAATTAQLP